jgi:hypothetical protein
MKELKLTDKQKELASRAAQVMAAGHTDDFWTGVQQEVDRLEKAPKIKPRKLR